MCHRLGCYGLDDLIVAGREVVWYQNTGSATAPKLGASQLLVRGSLDFHVEIPDAERTAPTRSYSVCVVDFDADGRFDLLLGNHCIILHAVCLQHPWFDGEQYGRLIYCLIPTQIGELQAMLPSDCSMRR
jgi:hypothetical protein